MRFFLAAPVLIFLIIPAMAQGTAVDLFKSNDPAIWNAACSGIMQEMQRQAEESNNQLQFDQSKRRLAALANEAAAKISTKEWVVTVESRIYWINQGKVIAGHDYWDGPNKTDTRDGIIQVRLPFLDKCQSLGDLAEIYAAPALQH